MDLIKIDRRERLADLANEANITAWFTEDWESNVLRSYKMGFGKKDQKIPIKNLCFTVGDDHVELYDGIYQVEPKTEIDYEFGGRLTTLAFLNNITVIDGKVEGKICIRNLNKPTINADYEICLNRIEVKMRVGLGIRGDGLGYDYCIFEFPSASISFSYQQNLQTISVFNKTEDENKKKLLEQYILEYTMKDIYDGIENYQKNQLSVKLMVSTLTGNDYSLRNTLKLHNKKVHTAFKNFSKTIISLVISSITENSLKLCLDKVLGISKGELKVYRGFIENFASFTTMEKKDVILYDRGDLLILVVPVIFEKLKFNFDEVADEEAVNKIHKHSQNYTTSDAHFILFLKRLSKNKVEISLQELRIPLIEPKSKSLEIKITMDYLVTSAMENHVKPHLEFALKNEKLQQLAIKPDL